jgi:Fur family peroxide stress response transcriptional regulator
MSTPVKNLFAEHGLRCTQQRLCLYQALASSDYHPTADELFKTVSRDLPGISLATVYNTLEAFCDVGLAQKLPGVGTNGSARFDAMCHNHLHLRDLRTGEVADVPEELGQAVLNRIPEDLLQQLESRLGFKINQMQIELVGEYDQASAGQHSETAEAVETTQH